MQINVKNIEYISQSVNILNNFTENVKIIASNNLSNIQKLTDEILQELNISENFLSIAKVKEVEKFTILTQKESELVVALQEEVAALASGNPIAIAAASAYVAQKSQEVYIAEQNYYRAKKNRINMERRVELVNLSKYQNDVLFEETNNIFKINNSSMDTLKTHITMRLQNAFNSLSEYFSNSEYLNDIEIVTPSNLKEILQLDDKKGKEFYDYLYASDKNFKLLAGKLKEEYKNARTDFEREKVIRKIRQNLSGIYTEKYIEQSLKNLGDIKTQHIESVEDSYSKVDILLENVKKPIILGKGKCKHIKKGGSLAIEIKTGSKEYLRSQKEHLIFQIQAHKQSADASIIITTKDINELKNEDEFRDIFKQECSGIVAMLPKKSEIDQNIIDAMELQ